MRNEKTVEIVRPFAKEEEKGNITMHKLLLSCLIEFSANKACIEKSLNDDSKGLGI
jgi:hypothetical protein